MNSTIRIVTLNTWKCDGLYEKRLEEMTAVFHKINPDIISLQEVFDCPETGHDTAKYLAECLHFNYITVKTRLKHRLFNGIPRMSTSGLAILSKYPLTGKHLELPSDPRDGDRHLQTVYVTLPECQLSVFNTHLTHLKKQSPLRSRQMSVILDHLRSERSQTYNILCGDFNADLSSPELQQAIINSGLNVKDTYILGQGKEPRHSLLPVAGKNSLPQSCIDFILWIPCHDCTEPEFLNAQPVAYSPGTSGEYASDHCGFCVDMRIGTC